MSTKKWFCFILICAVAGLYFAACASSGDNPSGKNDGDRGGGDASHVGKPGEMK